MSTAQGAVVHVQGHMLEIKDTDTLAADLLGKLRDHRGGRFIATGMLRKKSCYTILIQVEYLFLEIYADIAIGTDNIPMCVASHTSEYTTARRGSL
jgi:hypothetical protein